MARPTRLIDANALPELYIIAGRMNGLEIVAKAINEMIQNAPTIDAIPVSFIQELIERDKQLIKEYGGKPDFEVIVDGLIDRAVNYEALIEKWREKNSKND